MLRLIVFSLLFIVSYAGNIFAHDTWVEVNTPVIRKGDVIHVDLKLGNHGNNHRDFKLASKITLAPCVLKLITPDQKELDLKDRIIDTGYAPKEGYWSAKYVSTDTGLYTVLHTLDVLHGTAKAIKSAKTYFIVNQHGEKQDFKKQADRATGHPFEFVMLTHPVAGAAPGRPVRVKLLYQGKPAAGSRVAFIPRGVELKENEDAEYERTTDSEGIVEFTPREGNLMLIVAHREEPDQKGEGYEKTYYSATITLNLPQIPYFAVNQETKISTNDGVKNHPTNWPTFLGQGADKCDPQTIPVTWTPVENIAWKTKLPGRGQSSPVVWGDTIYVTDIDGTMKERCHLNALQLSTGELKWTKTLEAYQPIRSNYFQSRSAPTPIVDEQGVYAFFETGNVVAFTHEGKDIWTKNLVEEYGPFESTIGLASSPLQTKDDMIILVDHEGPSYLLAINKKTGNIHWKSDRESRVSYASPSLVKVGNETHIVVSSAGSVEGFHPETGAQLWKTKEVVGGNRATTPLDAGNQRFVMSASPGMHGENEAEAKKSNGIMEIIKTAEGYDAKFVWRTEEALPAFNTPLVYEGRAYWVNRAGVVFCYDAITGEKKYVKRIKQGCWAMPVGIGEHVYIFGKDGVTTVLKTGDEFQLVAENQLWDPEKAGNEAGARSFASGGDSVGHRHNTEAKPADEKAKAPAKTENTADGKPATQEEPAKEEPRGGRPAMTPEQEQKAREQGDNRFADPVQYGVAVVNGNIIIRTGEYVYCVRKVNHTVSK